jgi:hypothetical protein
MSPRYAHRCQSDALSETMMECWDLVPGGLPRAPRYALQLDVRYRRDARDPADAHKTWHAARTIDVSRSGVLLTTDETVAPGTTLELALLLPHDVACTHGVTIQCWCRTVRLDAQRQQQHIAVIAAEILSYAFHRDDPRTH